jgi:hypothetical protein
MQSDTQSLVAEKGKGKGLLELALEHGNLHTLPLLVSMGVCWQERAVGQPPLNARSVKGCKPRVRRDQIWSDKACCHVLCVVCPVCHALSSSQGLEVWVWGCQASF